MHLGTPPWPLNTGLAGAGVAVSQQPPPSASNSNACKTAKRLDYVTELLIPSTGNVLTGLAHLQMPVF